MAVVFLSLKWSSSLQSPRGRAASPRLPSGLLGCSFGFPVGTCFDLGHLHICRSVKGKAWAHAFNGLLVSCLLLLQGADHVLHFTLPRKEVLHTRLQRLNLLPRSLESTDMKYRILCKNTNLNGGQTQALNSKGPQANISLKAITVWPETDNNKTNMLYCKAELKMHYSITLFQKRTE